VDDISVGLEHVDLLNCLNGLDIKLLKCCLQLLVIHASALVDLLDLSSRGAFSTVRSLLVLIDLRLILSSHLPSNITMEYRISIFIEGEVATYPTDSVSKLHDLTTHRALEISVPKGPKGS